MSRKLSRALFVTVVVLIACQSRERGDESTVGPAMRGSKVVAAGEVDIRQPSVCPRTQIRVATAIQANHQYLCEIVSRAWSAVDTNTQFRQFAITDSAGRPPIADLDCARMNSAVVPPAERSVQWVVNFPSSHADSAGITVRVDSVSGGLFVYRHAPFLHRERRPKT